MYRLHMRSAGACLVLLLLVTGCASGPPSRPDDVCSIFTEKRGWHQVALDAEEKWGTSMHIPMAFIYQESAFRSQARPARRWLLGFIPWRRPSSAYGFAQAINTTWREYIDDTGEYWRVRDNFADATDFVHWYLAMAVARNGVRPDDTFSLYINYHEGPTGFARQSHLGKPWLSVLASAVHTRSERYAAQYRQCRDSLPRSIWSRLFG